MGQIKNIKLHIVTDIKLSVKIPRRKAKKLQRVPFIQHLQNERQMEGETCEKVEEKKKKDERKVKVNQPQLKTRGRCGCQQRRVIDQGMCADLNIGNELIDIQICMSSSFVHLLL